MASGSCRLLRYLASMARIVELIGQPAKSMPPLLIQHWISPAHTTQRLVQLLRQQVSPDLQQRGQIQPRLCKSVHLSFQLFSPIGHSNVPFSECTRFHCGN